MICNDSFTQLVLYGSFVPLPVAMGGLRTTGYVATSVGVIALLGVVTLSVAIGRDVRNQVV